MRPKRVISGGQTGVDRAALDAAMAAGIPVGGWCPKGRRAEDGPIDPRYPLVETESADYRERTERNVRDADATLILSPTPLTGGTLATARACRKWNKPFEIVDPWAPDAAARIRAWLRARKPQTLNIAGPRESQRPGIGEQVRKLLAEVFAQEEASDC